MYVYAIISNATKKAYIGSTSLHYRTRFANHVVSYNRGYNKCSSYEVLCENDRECVVVHGLDEKTTTISRLKEIEKETIQKFQNDGFIVVNRNVPGRTLKQYYEDNKETILERMNNKYANDPEYRQKIIDSAKGRYSFQKEFSRLCKIEL
jgi:hypothetical protein